MSTANYLVLLDAWHTIRMSVHESERAWSRSFNLDPDAVVDNAAKAVDAIADANAGAEKEMAVLLVQLDPASGSDITVQAEVNGVELFQAKLVGGVNRSRIEPFRARLLRWQNNSIVLRLYAGDGSARVGKAVLWFHTQAPAA